MIKASIIGATGYAGAELARLLSSHTEVQIMRLCSKSYAGERFGNLYPGHICSDYILDDINISEIAQCSDVVFTALPHGISSQTVLELNEYDIKIIDLSGDYRYDDEDIYEKWYGLKHPSPSLLKQAVYGLSEIYKEKIKSAKVIANPGCYTTCSILSILPLVINNLIDIDSIIIDAKSGVTGAGRKPSQALHFCEVQDNFKSYKIANHRHTSEIEQELSKGANSDIRLSFTPHLLPIKRGILETIYMTLNDGVTQEDIDKAYNQMYKDEQFIKLLGANNTPEIKHAVGSNSLVTGYVIDSRLNRLVVVSVIDNLIKGAAGQAVQNMNIMFSLDEGTGLNAGAWYL